MAQEKPSTLLAAQVWVADQRCRWNDLASLHLADIDLLLDKQLKWVNDHSDIDTLLSTLTIWADTTNDHAVTKPVAATDSRNNNAHKETYITSPAEHNITAPSNQSNVHWINSPYHTSSHTSTTPPNPITIIPEPTHISDEKSSLTDNNTCNATKDVKIPQIADSLTTIHDDDLIISTREPSAIEESKETEQPYLFNDDYNNELSVELIVNTLDNEPQSHHDTKSDDEDTLMSDMKKQESEENKLQHSLMEESIELDERPDVVSMIDYSTLHGPVNVVLQEQDPDMEVSEKSTKDNSHKPGTFFSDIQSNSQVGLDDESRRITQTMKPIFIEDSAGSVKHLQLENKNSTDVQESKNQNEENDKFKSVDVVLSVEESDMQQTVHVDDNIQVSSLHELEISPENEVASATNVLYQQQGDASHDDYRHYAPRSPPKRSFAEMLSPSPDTENIRPCLPAALNDKVMEHKLSPRNKKDDILAPNLSNRPSDMNSSPMSAPRLASKSASPLKDVQNLSHDSSPTKDDKKHTSSSLLKYASSTDVSPLQNIENIKYVSPPSRNDITPEDHGISSKSDHPTSLSSADHNDDEDDMDEVILVGAENSTKWVRPAPQRISKMPAIQKDRRNKPAGMKPEHPARAHKEQVSGRGKADISTTTTSKSQTKSLSLKKQKLPPVEKDGLPLDKSNDSNVVSLTGNKQIAKREAGISSSKPLANGESTFMKKLLGAYKDEKRKSVDEEIPLDKLERGLEEVLRDVNRNSLEVNKSLCTLDENRDYLHTKRDIARQRHYMSPTVSRLKRLQVQETNQKLQSKLLVAQSTPHAMFNSHERNNAKTKLTGAVGQSHMSNSKANSDLHSLQQPRKKRLGILNGRNAERLKIVQQRRILQERELVDGPTGEGNLTRSQESSQDLTKLASSQSFAKATLSTQLKTHKPIESSSKAAHIFHGISKPQTSTASKSNETQTKQKPLDISHRNQQAQAKQTNQDINNLHQNSASNQDGISIPNTTTSDKTSQEEDPRPRKRAKLPMPGWAMSPELKKALEAQCTLNPEEIFGKMAPLRIEEIFSKGKS